MKKYRAYGAVMLCMLACPMNSFGMHTENAKRVIEYLAYKAGGREFARSLHLDEEKSSINTNIYDHARLGQHIKIGFGPSNRIGSGKNLAYLCGLMCQGQTYQKTTADLKDRFDRKSKKKISIWEMKRKKLHVSQRKFPLMKIKE